MITIHHLGVSQSDRIVWLMEELGLPYKMKYYRRRVEDNSAPDDYLALHPAATSPIIEDGDTVLCESAAIVEYICNKYGEGRLVVKPHNDNYANYLYWMQFNSNALCVFMAELAMTSNTEVESSIQRIISRRKESYYQCLELHLAKHKFLAGDEFTCADIMSVFALTTLPLFGGRGIDDLPHAQEYIANIKKRPAYHKAMLISGPEAVF